MSKPSQNFVLQALDNKNIFINEILINNQSNYYDVVFQSVEKSYVTKVSNKLLNLVDKYDSIDQIQIKQLLLLAACYLNKVDKVKELLQNENIDVNFNQSIYISPPLHLACENCNIELVELLLNDKNIKINLQSRARAKSTPIHTLSETQSINSNIQEKILKIILRKGGLIELRNAFNETPLHVSLYYENYNFAKCLIKYGANVYSMSDNKTCLDYCLEHDNHNSFLFFKFLIENYNFMEKALNMLEEATIRDSLEYCKLLIENIDKVSNKFMESLFYVAIKNDSLQIFSYYTTVFKIKLSINELILNLKDNSSNDNYLKVCIRKDLIRDFHESSSIVSKLLDFISSEHLSVIEKVKNSFKTKTDVEVKRDIINANKLLASRLYFILKHASICDSHVLQEFILKHLFINDVISSFYKSELWLFNEEQVFCIIQMSILSGFLSQFEINLFLQKFEEKSNNFKPKYRHLGMLINHYLNNFLSLREICRIRLRQILPHELVHKLDCPIYFKNYLMYNDLKVPKEWNHL